jgi:type IV/VI secretion system ImpK/VasF family protein
MDRVTDVTRRCFDAIIELRRADSASLMPERLHRDLCTCIDALFTRAEEVGFNREEARDVAYAVVALADEVVASRSTALAQYWAGHSLQLKYFRDVGAVAGEEFFSRLENVQNSGRREVLQAYALALQLGFQGRHSARGGEAELLRILDKVERDLARGRGHDGILSPHGERPDDGPPAIAGNRLAMWIAIGSLAVALVLYAGLRLSLGASTDSVLERIHAVSQPRTPP